MTFHIRDGWRAERLVGSGSVTIVKEAEVPGDTGVYLTMTDTEWASVVASVCARGETAVTYGDALAFHNDKGKGSEAPGGERVDVGQVVAFKAKRCDVEEKHSGHLHGEDDELYCDGWGKRI